MPNQIANLNVRLGFVFDQKSLDRIERTLRRSGEKMSRVGTDLSLAISAPLGALGVASIKAAGNLESLENALKSQLGSAEAAKKELELLRQEALKPGLGFEQAVKGSVSLQAVGFSANFARQTISEFGNALALAGKGKAELDGVTLALTQIAAKGVVSAEEINQIAERLPQIRTLMKAAFGTASTEEIQKLGITASQFTEGIVKEMQKLPRATGGIKNSIENAGDAVTQFLGSIGAEINKAFNLTELSEQLSTSLKSASAAFASLDDSTKRTIVQFGIAVVAAGPLIKVFAAFQLGAAQVLSAWSGIVGAAKTLVGSLVGVEGALTRVKLALGIVGVVVGLGAAVYALSDNFDAAEFAADAFADSQKQIIDQTANEIGLLNKSFGVLKDETKSRFEKGKVVDELLRQYPQYLKGIDLETASVSRLTEIQKNLNASILQGVAERQKATAVNSIYEKQAETLLRIQQIRDGAKITASEATLIDTGDWIEAGSRAEAVILKLQQRANELGNQVGVVSSQFDKAFGAMNNAISPTLKAQYGLRDAYYAEREAIEENVKSKAAYTTTTNVATTSKKAQKDAINAKIEADREETEQMEKYAKMVREIEQAWLDEAIAEDAARAVSIGAVDTSMGPSGGEMQLQSPGADVSSFSALTPQAEHMEAMTAAMLAMQEGTASYGETFSQVSAMVAQNGTIMEQVFLGMGEAMAQVASSGTASFGALASAAVGAAAKVVRAWIQQGVAAAVAKALGSIPFPFNIAAGAAAGALAAGAFTKALNLIGVPKFEKGTKNAPGGMALVGERGPELVNLPKASHVYNANQTRGLMGKLGQAALSGEFTVRGTDLVLILEKTQRKNERFR